MIVRLVWPDCSYLNEQWGEQMVDSFWLQCSEKEADEIVIPSLTKAANPKEAIPATSGEYGPPYCFLVSRDLSSIVQMAWYYPYSGMWNDECPFRQLPQETEVHSLQEITGIKIPESFRGSF